MRTSLTLVVTLVVPTLMSCVSDSAELDGPPLDGGERPRIPDATSPEPFGDLRDPDALPPSVELDDEPLIFARGARFRDVQASWANAMISSLSERGVIAGYSDGTFRPNHLVTRAELAALLVAAFPRCATTRPVRAFRDVPESHWAHAAVDRAQRCAMMSGYPDGSFGPARSTTRVEALVAIHGALRGTTPSVDERAGIVERWSAGARASAVHERYFDAARIPAWAHAALISATEAGMVILGADREGIERGARRVLLHDVAATRADVAALLYGAVNHPRGDDLGENPRPPAGGAFRATPYRGEALLDGEWVLSFDDGPRASSVQVARALRAKGVTGLFFMVSHTLGWVDANGVQLNPSTQSFVDGVLREGHVLANHSHRHCIRGASCGGRGLAELPSGELSFELETTHRVLRASIAHAGHRPTDKMLHFFRAPGSQDGASWSAAAAASASTARLPGNYRGTIAWDLPRSGHDIGECWNRGLDGAACATRYLREIDAARMRKGVILIHDNFPQAADMVGPLIDGLRARGMRVVHPRCVVGCSRP
ncbi:MAG: S-layer homology domain-containing protein [Myxococcales bacterium]|nr:S-layer homology domain-containing protein [Myxococcales bacterium]